MSPYSPHLLMVFLVVWRVFAYQVISQLATSVRRKPRWVAANAAGCSDKSQRRSRGQITSDQRTVWALRFSSWSDARGLSASYSRVVRSVGREGRPPQWGVVHEHTSRPTPVFRNTQKKHSNLHWPTGAYEEDMSSTHVNSR